MPITLIFFRPISHVFYPLGSIQPGCGFWCLGLWGFTSGPIYMMTMTSYIISSFKSSIYNLGIKHLVLMVLLICFTRNFDFMDLTTGTMHESESSWEEGTYTGNIQRDMLRTVHGLSDSNDVSWMYLWDVWDWMAEMIEAFVPNQDNISYIRRLCIYILSGFWLSDWKILTSY